MDKMLKQRLHHACLLTGLAVGLLGPSTTHAGTLSAIGVASIEDFENINGSGQSYDGSGLVNQSGIFGSPEPRALDTTYWKVEGLSDGDTSFFDTGTPFPGPDLTSGDYARGTASGGETFGGLYAFNTGGVNTALGFQPSGSDLTPGSLTYRVENLTGESLNSLDFAVDLFTYNDQGRASSVEVAWSLFENTGYQTLFSRTSPESADGTSAWSSETLTASINLPGGLAFLDSVYFRFLTDDVSGSGSRDELGIDNISVTGFNDTTAIPSPTAMVAGLIGMAGLVVRRRRRN